MKKTLLALFAVAIAISASAYKPLVTDLFVSASSITIANVTSTSSYQETAVTCQTNTVAEPCRIDLTQLAGVDSEAEFISYLQTNFSTPEQRVEAVNDLAVAWKP